MSVSGTWGSTFDIICVSIIYRVHIISIANIPGRFMVSDTLYLLKAYQIVNDNSVMSDRYIYLYYHLYKVPTTPCDQDIILNHLAYLEDVEELPTYSIRQIYYGDRCNNANSVNIEYPLSGPSSFDDTFSLMVSPVLAPSPLYNQICHIISPYSMTVNSSQIVQMLKMFLVKRKGS